MMLVAIAEKAFNPEDFIIKKGTQRVYLGVTASHPIILLHFER